LATSHEVGLEINAKKIKYMFMSFYRDSSIKKKAANGNKYCIWVKNLWNGEG
jgi:hypothetical protein